jgi:hypothetical protein
VGCISFFLPAGSGRKTIYTPPTNSLSQNKIKNSSFFILFCESELENIFLYGVGVGGGVGWGGVPSKNKKNKNTKKQKNFFIFLFFFIFIFFILCRLHFHWYHTPKIDCKNIFKKNAKKFAPFLGVFLGVGGHPRKKTKIFIFGSPAPEVRWVGGTAGRRTTP